MIKHIVMWKLLDSGQALHFKAQLDSCRNLVPGMLAFEAAIRTAEHEANCDVVLYSAFQNKQALAAYQSHPHHQLIGRGLGALRESRCVLDYEMPGDTP